MTLPKILILLAIGYLSGGRVYASDMPCPPKLAKDVEEAAAKLANWPSIHRAYKKYRACDDGAIAEGFTESVVKVLANKWNTLPELQRFARRDTEFLDFVYRHITESADPEDLRVILLNTKTKECAKTSRKLCAEIRSRTRIALERV